jgi:hypothetical protein
MADDEPTIAVKISDVLNRLESKVDQLVATLGLKADRQDLLELEHKLGGVEGRVIRLEHEREAAEQHYKERIDHRRWLIPTLAAVGAALATFIAAFASMHGH